MDTLGTRTTMEECTHQMGELQRYRKVIRRMKQGNTRKPRRTQRRKRTLPQMEQRDTDTLPGIRVPPRQAASPRGSPPHRGGRRVTRPAPASTACSIAPPGWSTQIVAPIFRVQNPVIQTTLDTPIRITHPLQIGEAGQLDGGGRGMLPRTSPPPSLCARKRNLLFEKHQTGPGDHARRHENSMLCGTGPCPCPSERRD